MIRQRCAKRQAKLVLADPDVSTWQSSPLHLRQRSATDIALLNGGVVSRKGWETVIFIEGAQRVSTNSRKSSLPPDKVSAITGISNSS
jgi:hypothetical protein